MNRQILFKAKRKDNGEWVEGYYVYCRKRRYILQILNKEIGFDERENEWIEIDPGTICQYTGLTDKNGKKIFEGDVVKYVDVCGEVKFGLHESTWQINKYNQGFFVTFPKEYSLRSELGFWRNKIVVIGNIFDNAELLEVE